MRASRKRKRRQVEPVLTPHEVVEWLEDNEQVQDFIETAAPILWNQCYAEFKLLHGEMIELRNHYSMQYQQVSDRTSRQERRNFLKDSRAFLDKRLVCEICAHRSTRETCVARINLYKFGSCKGPTFIVEVLRNFAHVDSPLHENFPSFGVYESIGSTCASCAKVVETYFSEITEINQITDIDMDTFIDIETFLLEDLADLVMDYGNMHFV
jgi:hypothetical protein